MFLLSCFSSLPVYGFPLGRPLRNSLSNTGHWCKSALADPNPKVPYLSHTRSRHLADTSADMILFSTRSFYLFHFLLLFLKTPGAITTKPDLRVRLRVHSAPFSMPKFIGIAFAFPDTCFTLLYVPMTIFQNMYCGVLKNKTSILCDLLPSSLPTTLLCPPLILHCRFTLVAHSAHSAHP